MNKYKMTGSVLLAAVLVSGLLAGCAAASGNTTGMEGEEENMSVNTENKMTDEAVSYTHLDVYKRQQEYPMHPGRQSEEQKQRRERRFAEAGAKRESRFSSYYEEEKAAEYLQEAFMLRAAGENFGELYEFLVRDGSADRRRMLHSLSAKDYKDLKKEVLEDHLLCERGDWPEDIYVKYLLCPRIGRELSLIHICPFITEISLMRIT